jgi:membrane protease YdiL (CAAX protease family)
LSELVAPQRRSGAWLPLAGLAGSLILRVAVAGPAGARSVTAGLVFGACLVLVAVSAGFRPGRPTLRPVLVGIAGAAVLCLPPLVHRVSAGGAVLPTGQFPAWAAVVALVAVAEEVLLRGVVFDRLLRARGTAFAVVVTSVAFAALHAPLYGMRVLPLDLAVGVWLGALKVATGSVAAPATAHVAADLAGWWLV